MKGMRNIYILILLGIMLVMNALEVLGLNDTNSSELNVSVLNSSVLNSTDFFDSLQKNNVFSGIGDDFVVRPSSFNELCWLGPGDLVKDCFVRFGSNIPFTACESGGAYCEIGNLTAKVGFRKENDNFIYDTENMVISFTGNNGDNQVCEGRISFVNLGFSVPLPEFQVSGARNDGLLAWFFDIRDSSIKGIRWYFALVLLLLFVNAVRRRNL